MEAEREIKRRAALLRSRTRKRRRWGRLKRAKANEGPARYGLVSRTALRATDELDTTHLCVFSDLPPPLTPTSPLMGLRVASRWNPFDVPSPGPGW